MRRRSVVSCPVCGFIARRVYTRYGTRHECCGLWSWNGKPLTDKRTHDARKAAHEAFDPFWRSGVVSRTQAYTLLAETLQVPIRDCHMALMSAEVAERVPAAVRKIKTRLTRERNKAAVQAAIEAAMQKEMEKCRTSEVLSPEQVSCA